MIVANNISKSFGDTKVLKSVSIAFEKGKTNLRSEEHTSELQSQAYLVCRLLLEKKKTQKIKKILIIIRLTTTTY